MQSAHETLQRAQADSFRKAQALRDTQAVAALRLASSTDATLLPYAIRIQDDVYAARQAFLVACETVHDAKRRLAIIEVQRQMLDWLVALDWGEES